MDNMDPCNLDRKGILANTVWQWRIMHVRKYSRNPEPFVCSNKIGLDFNVGSTKEKKLNVGLLTNGVVLEICDFAKTVKESKRHFVTNILERNFDLGLESEQQRADFTKNIHLKLKDLVKTPLKNKHESFSLFDTSAVPSCTSSIDNGQNVESNSKQEQMETDGDYGEHEAKTVEMDDSDDDQMELLDRAEMKVDVYPLSFPCCEEIGLSFDLKSQQHLNPDLLTKAVMLELVDFSRVLSASYSSIVLVVLDNNFDLDVKSQQKQVLFTISELLKKRKQLATKIGPQFEDEPFSFQTNPLKQPQGSGQPCMEALQRQNGEVTKKREFDLQTEQNLCLKNQSDRSKEQRDDQQMLLPTTVPCEHELAEEEMGSQSNIWKWRAKRVKQIVFESTKHSCKGWRHKTHLEFNVGFTPKQNLHPSTLTYFCLFKIARFALAVNSSKSEFIMDILESNFDIGFYSAYHKHVFACEMMRRVRELQNCENAVKFSKDVFELPDPMSSINMEYESKDDGSLEFSCMPGTETCDVAIDSHFNAEDGTTQPESVEPYPFCKDIGLKLCASYSQPNKKLHINKLTKGAMTEVTSFAEKLCGTFEQICFDILKHNFDVDFQSVDSDLFKSILSQIPVANDIVNFVYNVPSNYKDGKLDIRDPSVLERLQCQRNSLEAHSTCSTQASSEQNIKMSIDAEQQNDDNSLLWKLRSNHIEQILSVHEEHCPLYSYSRCKKLGIDFNVGSGIKQNLDPKLITNGIIVELHSFASALMSSTKYFMTEILDYNFDLNLNTEHLRNAYGEELWRQFDKIKRKRQRVSFRKRLVKLPAPESIESLEKYAPHCLCNQNRNQMLLQEAFEQNDMLHHHPHAMKNTASVNANSTNQKPVIDPVSTFPASDSLLSPYRECSNIGLSLCVDNNHPKEKLKSHEVTGEVLAELLIFSKRLSGTRPKIVLDIIAHNFNLDLQDAYEPSFRQIPFDGSFGWFNEAFVVQVKLSKPHIRKECCLSNRRSDMKESIRQRQLQIQRNQERVWLHSDVETDESTDSENQADKRDLQSATNAEINMAPQFESQSDKSKEQADEQPMLLLPVAPNECDMIKDEMERKINIWKLRAKRARQILLKVRKDYFRGCIRIRKHPEFNFAPKQNLCADKLTYSVLFRVARFASTLSSSKPEFIMDILESNFDLGLQSAYHKHVFVHELMKRVRELQSSKDAVKFSNERFELPDPVSSTMPGTAAYDLALGSHFKTEPHWHTEDGTTQEKNADPYPFCKDIGLKLCVSDNQPVIKLQIDKLTKGAMTEVTIFAEKLCGTFEQICFDILRHNFDIDLQSVDSNLFQNILRQIPMATNIMNLEYFVPIIYKDCKLNMRDPSVIEQLQYQSSSHLEANSPLSIPESKEQKLRISTDTEHLNDLDLLLWKLRSNHIHQILLHHGEHCSLYSYSRCKKFGIDFNVGSGIKQSLDPKLITNGLMVELNTFASELLSSTKDLVTEILEYNFDLNLHTKHIRSAYGEELWRQFGKLKRKKALPSYRKRLVNLPAPESIESIEEYALHCVCNQDRNQMLLKEDLEQSDMFHHHSHAMTGVVSANAKSRKNEKPAMGPVSTFPSSRSLCSPYRECRNIGLSLCVDNNHPKEKLKSYEVNREAMLELFSFSKRLCGTRPKIILDILAHNFNLDLEKLSNTFVPHFRKVQFDGGLAFFNEAYVFQEKLGQPSNTKEWCLVNQRSDMTEGARQLEMKRNLENSPLQNDVETDESTDSENWVDEDHLHNATSSEINVVPGKNKEQGDEQQMLLSATPPNEYNMIPDETGSETNVWNIRAKHIKQILQKLNNKYRCPFLLKCDVEFNVGFAPKQNLSAERLTHSVLFKVARFALSLSSSKTEFIIDILESNFDLGLQNAYHKHVFVHEFMKRVRELQSCKDAVKFSNERFELPHPLSLIDMEYQSMDDGELCSHTEHGTTQPKNVEPYPFCKDIGLKLCATDIQPSKKLHINKLTKGAMAEVTIFAEKLCGTFEQICFDILRHNFDLDLQSVDSDLFQNILRQIPAATDMMNLACFVPHDVKVKYSNPEARDPSVLNQLHYQGISDLEANCTASKQADHNISMPTDTKKKNDLNSFLWTMRSDRIQEILSVHEEHCPLYSYSRCKKLGIDFNVRPGVKQSLDTKYLTNGLMVELYTFSSALMSSTKDFMAEILDYNYHLNLNTEHLRSAYAEQLWREFLKIKPKRHNHSVRKKRFKMPDLQSIEEQAPHCMCNKNRNQMNLHAISDLVSANANGTEEKLSLDSFFPSVGSYSKEIGLSLCMDKNHPKEKLQTHEMTCGAMVDVFFYANRLSGTRWKIIFDIIEYNFNLPLGDFTGPCLMLLFKVPFDGDLVWFNQRYVFPLQSSARHKWKQFQKQGRILQMQNNAESDQSTDSENGQEEDYSTTNSKMPFVPPFARQSDESKQQDGQQLLLPTTSPNECDLEEEMGLESNMWKLRAEHVAHILFELCNDQFFNKTVSLEFNVGFRPKQNLSPDILTHSVLFKVAQFALAMSSSQFEFIMKILENNFDLSLDSIHHDVFTCEMMKKIRELQNCEDAVKFSGEIFELPDPLSAEPDLHSTADSQAEPDLHVETNPTSLTETDSGSQAETTPSEGADLYPFCKDIGIKLHVGNSQPSKKLCINKLTKGAMAEVAAFAEKLCGTFEEICFDVLRHNFDLHLPSVDCHPFQNILAQIPAANDTVNLATISHHVTSLHLHKDPIVLTQLPSQTKPIEEGNCYAVMSQALKDHNYADNRNGIDSFLWTLRTNRIQQILLVHGEHCPLYSYSRCKKLGIDFNIGSGEKRNLDPKFLTNGIMVELHTFAKELMSSRKDFITEILEYNFDLKLKGELHRNAYALELMGEVLAMKAKRATVLKVNRPFEIPDPKSVVGSSPCCPKCYQDRNYKSHQGDSNPDHILHQDTHIRTDIISADANCTTQNPAMDLVSNFPALETIFRSYPHCIDIGLNLCVSRDHPKQNLDKNLLTWTVIKEVSAFAKTLSGKKHKIVDDVLAHNFNLDMQNSNMHPSVQFYSNTCNDQEPPWFDEVFVIQTQSPKPSSQDAPKIETRTAIKRKLEVQTNAKQVKLRSDDVSNHHSSSKISKRMFPVCSEIGLDLDVTSKSKDKVKLDLNLLTIPVALEIQKFLSKQPRHYFPGTLYDILDYNFDISSQHHRKWEFSIETAGKFRSASRRRKNKTGAEDQVFKLPFVFENQPEKKNEKSQRTSHKKTNKSHEWAKEMPNTIDAWQIPLPSDFTFESNIGTQTHHRHLRMETCVNVLPGTLQVKEEPHYIDVKPDPDWTVTPKAEPNTEGIEHLVKSEPAGSCENALMTKSVSQSDTANVQYYILATPQASESSGMIRPCSTNVDTINSGLITPCFVSLTKLLPVQLMTMSQSTVNTSVKEEQNDLPVDNCQTHPCAEIEVTLSED